MNDRLLLVNIPSKHKRTKDWNTALHNTILKHDTVAIVTANEQFVQNRKKTFADNHIIMSVSLYAFNPCNQCKHDSRIMAFKQGIWVAITNKMW